MSPYETQFCEFLGIEVKRNILKHPSGTLDAIYKKQEEVIMTKYFSLTILSALFVSQIASAGDSISKVYREKEFTHGEYLPEYVESLTDAESLKHLKKFLAARAPGKNEFQLQMPSGLRSKDIAKFSLGEKAVNGKKIDCIISPNEKTDLATGPHTFKLNPAKKKSKVAVLTDASGAIVTCLDKTESKSKATHLDSMLSEKDLQEYFAQHNQAVLDKTLAESLKKILGDFDKQGIFKSINMDYVSKVPLRLWERSDEDVEAEMKRIIGLPGMNPFHGEEVHLLNRNRQ